MAVGQTQIHGQVETGFEPVRDLLEQQFAKGEHIGAGVCAYHHGHKVVDLWGGLANDDTKQAWLEDTMAVSYSTTKGLTATCLHVLAERGLVDYQAPVAKYWPEFAQNGKEKITVYHLLTHQSGMAGVPEGLYGADLFDWERVIHALERDAPAWEPGAESGYHALTFGFLVGEVVRRVSGRSVGTFLRDEVCTPLGFSDEMYVGAPESAEPRIAKLKNRIVVTPEMVEQFQNAQSNADPLRARAMGMRPGATPGGDRDDWLDTPAGHRAEVPAVSGIMTARALARMYACLANYGELDGVRLMSESTVRIMSERQTYRPDRILVMPIGWALGYMTGGTEGWPQGPRVSAFGHAGLGGSIGFCDPEIGMAFGFTTNAMAMDLIGYGRTAALAGAARACCEALT
jgi:CubicO group peptidase (beta-lactamase class C family)